MMLLLSLILPLFAAFFLICCLWPGRELLFPLVSVKTSFAVGLGTGISSCLFFVCLLFFDSVNRFSVITEITVLAALTVFSLLYIIRKRNCNASIEINHVLPVKWDLYSFLFVIFWIVLILAVLFFIFRSLNTPHGDWDAWAIWNMRARFLFRSGDRWALAFSDQYPWSHPDYPLLIPGNIARIWNYTGKETLTAPAATAFMFTFATLGLVAGSMSYLRCPVRGLLAGLALMGMTSFTSHGASQYADIPFGFYLSAIVILFFLQDRIPEKASQFAFLAGIMAGFSAWTKNEGLLLIISVCFAHFAITVPVKGWKYYSRELFPFSAGLVPILVILVYFKTQLAPPNDLFSGQGLKPAVSRLADISRYLIVGKAFIISFLEVMKGRIAIFIVCFIFFRFSYDKQYKKSICISLLIMALMLAGYYFVYITSPHNLAWHLNTSLNRLLFQLLPSGLFIFFFLTPFPGIRKVQTGETYETRHTISSS
ncbi:MAG: hypothetical protein GY795_47390 [Desulfobacterales bacterium]|nr:hypothetical protein [Desulfobacterales bacterium]